MEVQDKLNLNVTVTVLRISYKQHIFWGGMETNVMMIMMMLIIVLLCHDQQITEQK